MPQQPLTSSRRGERLRTVAVALPVTVVGFVSLLAFNVLQLLSLALLPLSRTTFRRFNRWCADTWWGWCVSTARRLNGTELVVSGDVVPPRENAIVVANHQQMPDITTIMTFARTKDRLGDLKFFVKKALKWVPGVGWGMQFINCLFVDRDWTSDRETIRRTFATLVEEQIPTWLVTFVEGTRATPEKIAHSQAFARERGLAVLEHVLLPRTKGFVAAVRGLGDHVAAVYDLTIGYAEGVPTLWQYIRGSVRRIHLHVRRFPVEDLPRPEEEIGSWLHQRFAEKDQLLDHFYATGSFPRQSGTDS